MVREALPYFLSKYLFGDRKRFGKSPNANDRDWVIWQEKSISDFYRKTQLSGIGNFVSGFAFSVVGRVSFIEKKVLEIGPGVIRHLGYIRDKPDHYTLCDVREDVLQMAKKQLMEAGIRCDTVLIDAESESILPFPEKSYDIIVSFNSLEHLHPLDDYLFEMKRVLVNGGLLVGGIPCEGGLGWGLGRLLTTRRFVRENYGINYDKIICWEHPNFADFIIKRLDTYFQRQYLKLHPFPFLPIDFNLVASFIYRQS